MLYVQLDVNWPDSEKILAAGMDGRGLHATALCIAKRLEKDGWIPLPILLREGADIALVERLVDLRLLERDGNRYRPWDWLEINPSSEEIRRKKSDSARAANHARWHDGPFESCEKCKAKIPCSSDADSVKSDPDDSDASEADPTGSLEVEVEPEGEAAAEPDPAVTPDDRTGRIQAACRAVAEERAQARDDIGPRWIPATAAGLATDHHQLLHRYLVANPHATIEDLVLVMDGAATPRKSEPINTSAFLQPIGAVIADRPAVDRDLNLKMVADLKCRGSHPLGEKNA